MINWLVRFSVRNKLLIVLSTLTLAVFGIYAIFHIRLGAVPDITNNQVQIITVSPNLSTEDVEQFITYPIELEMSHLSGIREIRSISRFGISVVTLVFDENMGTYLPRQLISEKLQTVTEKIPEGFGKPEMGPITTGLGEIYQYVLDVLPGYENRYSPMDLRTIHDWYIRRQLAGIDGVVEINSWGGYLKQYEISVNPERLFEYNISLHEVYEALIKNNSIAGGSYIEKNDRSYFIRGDGLIKSRDEILKIVIKNINGVPILLKDVAEVNVGFATRYGAITANGQGEKVMGQIMMLKGANSNKVMKEVKRRIEEIQKNLPEGIIINPITDRSELIHKTTTTVFENLLFGSIIVFLIVTLFLGNFRSALIISSVIPLSLLFTLGMMYLLDEEVNLMSLGALDFGVIIDGAVIIVEYIMVQLIKNKKLFENHKIVSHEKVDRITEESTIHITNAAIFGQLIVLIAFIPVYVLTGVEGKMFKPMAMSFSFALGGAILLGFTWIPVISSFFLRPPRENWLSRLSKKIIHILYAGYAITIRWALNHKLLVWGTAIVILFFSLFIFTRIGGEFVPTLDEGDFVAQFALKPGTSLSKTIEITTQMENILLKEFPDEVEKVVSRIGAAEVPTDPMGMEEVDMIINLKPQNYWKKARDKEELADLIKEALSVIPNVDIDFTQPIEMRFNELITGVRSDVAIKIFGEDIDKLNLIALQIKDLIKDVPGAADISVEKTVGLPQILIKYDRQKIAHYGVSIEELNKIVSMAFGGASTGLFFEGEKRFDIVVKLPRQKQYDIEDIRNLPVLMLEGKMIPLSEFAQINYYYGPAKISHDNTHRRTIVNVNVRNRDLKSVVSDIQQLINKHIELPPGYYIKYGGQFENLEQATRRLSIAVPLAMLLIIIFIHFALKSLIKALMVFVAVPMAVIGGILLLWLRGMPFSISAGIGFIALFGIAVMNGIVLIEHLDELQQKGYANLKLRILRSVKNRFRPVLLTASAAALGFLPMAISTSAGAEVQRPLATVVIGGLITSTFLTLVALPLLYYMVMSFQEKNSKLMQKLGKIFPYLSFALFLFPSNLMAQNQINLNTAIEKAYQHSKLILYQQKNVESQKTLIPSAFELNKARFFINHDENNIAPNGFPLTNWGIEQSFQFPGYYLTTKKLYTNHYEQSLIELEFYQNQVAYQVSSVFVRLNLAREKLFFFQILDTIYDQVLNLSNRNYESGNISKVELLTIQVKRTETKQMIQEQTLILKHLLQRFHILIGDTTQEPDTSLPVLTTFSLDSILQSFATYYYSFVESQYLDWKLQKMELLPDFYVQYFIGSNRHAPNDFYHGIEGGMSIPLLSPFSFFRIKSAKLKWEAAQYLAQEKLRRVQLHFQEKILEYQNMLLLRSNFETQETAQKTRFNLLTEDLGYGNLNIFQWIQIVEDYISFRVKFTTFKENLYETYFQIKYGIYEE